MIKKELIEKIKDIADDADINEIILGIEDFAKSSKFDVAKATVDDYKNMLASNEVIKAYYQSSFDSAVGSAVTKHDEKFKKEKLPSIIEEAVKAKSNEGKTPEQIKLQELEKKLADMESEKQKAELLNTNTAKLKEKGLDIGLAKYIQDDKDVDFFSNLINDGVTKGVKEKLGGSNYNPQKTDNTAG